MILFTQSPALTLKLKTLSQQTTFEHCKKKLNVVSCGIGCKLIGIKKDLLERMELRFNIDHM